MRIGIDISQSIYEGTGVARFTNGLITAILEYDRDNDWIFFFSSLRKSLDDKVTARIKNRGFKLVNYKVPPTVLSKMWNSIHRLRIEKLIGQVDWFITSDWTEPPADCKKTTIVHDLTFLRYPETVDPLIRKTQEKRMRWVKKESEIIFCDSIATQKDLFEKLKVESRKLKVIYPGVEIVKTNRLFENKKPFILTVGKVEPRKNLKRLIEAFEGLKNDNVELLIVGQRGWDKIKTTTKNVRFLGFVSDEELSALYQNCLFFIYPSIWEGFGYPVIEAMKLGAAVATSNTSSLKELGEDAALLFNPLKVSEIQSAIKNLISNSKLRQKLIEAGRKRAAEFTWQNYYNELINSLKNHYRA